MRCRLDIVPQVSFPILRRTHVDGVDRLVAGAVVHSDAGVLVLRRSPFDDFLPGIEELPSGGCDPGETLGDALSRELQEEIGWRGPVCPETGFSHHFDYVTNSGAIARQYTFSVPLGDQQINLSSEHTSWRWLGPEELDASDMTPESNRTVRQWWGRRRTC